MLILLITCRLVEVRQAQSHRLADAPCLADSESLAVAGLTAWAPYPLLPSLSSSILFLFSARLRPHLSSPPPSCLQRRLTDAECLAVAGLEEVRREGAEVAALMGGHITALAQLATTLSARCAVVGVYSFVLTNSQAAKICVYPECDTFEMAGAAALLWQPGRWTSRKQRCPLDPAGCHSGLSLKLPSPTCFLLLLRPAPL